QNSSTSPMISTPAPRASSTVQCGFGWVSGTPGDSTKEAKPDQSSVRRSPVAMPSPAALATLSGLSSQATTSAPPSTSARAVAVPEPPSPKRATRFPSKERPGIMKSPQLQTGETDEGQDHGDDPEADHDLAFGPAELLEMMMDRRHQEDAAAGHLEEADLDDDRQRLHDEEAADDGEHDLMLGGHRDGADQPAHGERAGVAHEDRGGRRIEPEEAEAGADDGAEHHGEFAGAGHEMDLQIFRSEERRGGKEGERG